MAVTSILSDDSVVVRLPDRTVHVDVTAQTLFVRASWSGAALGGSLVAAYPFSIIRRVRMRPGFAGGVAVEVVLAAGQALDLGDSGTPEGARMTARAVADLCRCQLDAGGGETSVPRASARFSEAPTFDEGGLDFPTGPIPVDARAALGVVPLEASPEPADETTAPEAPRRDPMDTRITRELLPAVTPADLAASAHTLDDDDAPVFEALLRESQIAAALSPEGLDAALEPEVTSDDADPAPTRVSRHGDGAD